MTAHRKIQLTIAMASQSQDGHMHEVGATGIAVEALGPGAWLIEIRVSDDSLVGDAWYETLEVYDHEFSFSDMIHSEQ